MANSLESSSSTQRVRVADGWGFRLRLDALTVDVTAGPDAPFRETFLLPRVRVGTAPDNDLTLHDPKVSRYHAELQRTEAGVILRDMGSTNGTFLAGVEVREAPLVPGQRCRLGDTELALSAEVQERVTRTQRDGRLRELVGQSAPMRELYGLLRTVAPTPVSVLIRGESGTGKELVARTIHQLSGRAGPLVVYDAASADPQMIRSDLFGHDKGAFTGAAGARRGAFRQADGGTLFLDEIGELPLDLQPRLLRVLESREVSPLGSDTLDAVDVRVVAATHRDLAAMATRGHFRLDLLHRLAVVPADVPALRARPEDIPALVDHFLELGGWTCRFRPEALRELARHPWPGNVRELRNIVDRLGALRPGGEVGPEHLGLQAVSGPAGGGAPAAPFDPQRAEVLEALERNGGNKAATARELGLSLSTLKRRLKRYGVP